MMAFILDGKRRFPRVKLQTAMSYRVLGGSAGASAIADNVSLGGVGFVSQDFIAPSTILNLELIVLSRVFNTLGRVAWSSPLSHSSRYQTGIEFTKLDDKDKDLLSDYIGLQLNQL